MLENFENDVSGYNRMYVMIQKPILMVLCIVHNMLKMINLPFT